MQETWVQPRIQEIPRAKEQPRPSATIEPVL